MTTTRHYSAVQKKQASGFNALKTSRQRQLRDPGSKKDFLLGEIDGILPIQN